MAKRRLYCKIVNPDYSFAYVDGEKREIKIKEMRIYEDNDLYGICCLSELPNELLKPSFNFAEIIMDEKIVSKNDFVLVLFCEDVASVFPRVHCFKKNYGLKEGRISDKEGKNIIEAQWAFVDKQKFLSLYDF